MRNFSNEISAHGEHVPLYVEVEGDENKFGQDTETWIEDREVLTYLYRDSGSPVFFFPPEDIPNSGDRLKYSSTWYELQEGTEYPTHAEIGAAVLEGWSP